MMKFMFKLLKALFKFAALIFAGALILMLVNEQVFPSASKTLFGFIFISYAALALVFVLKPSIFLRKSKLSVNDTSSASTELFEINETTNEKIKRQPEPFSEVKIDKDIAVSNDVSSDFGPLLSQLGREEKFVTMVALLALYGDGEFSDDEITKFREIISKIDFAPSSLIHRDETDESLCLDEKVVWALNFIKENFGSSADLEEEDIFSLFEELTKSLEQDIERDFADAKSRQEYSNKLKQALIEIAEADGTKSENETKLLATFKRASKYQFTPMKIFVALGLLGVIFYVVYWLFSQLF